MKIKFHLYVNYHKLNCTKYWYLFQNVCTWFCHTPYYLCTNMEFEMVSVCIIVQRYARRNIEDACVSVFHSYMFHYYFSYSPVDSGSLYHRECFPSEQHKIFGCRELRVSVRKWTSIFIFKSNTPRISRNEVGRALVLRILEWTDQWADRSSRIVEMLKKPTSILLLDYKPVQCRENKVLFDLQGLRRSVQSNGHLVI